ncbi:hypothetical protein [Desulfoluna spongiiphila]|uniref:hypothetical protein n=1 Tax=Desulfoluna spongiiphila TaxID=419481 RepID=UPI0011144FC2|nr:hypothetical protein [Desulfoluna spongiiphila]
MSEMKCVICGKKVTWWSGRFDCEIPYCKTCFRQERDKIISGDNQLDPGHPEFHGENEILQSDSHESMSNTIESNYGTALSISALMSTIGWLIVVIGLVAIVIGFSEGSRSGVSFIAALPGIGMSISGFFLVACAQVTRAVVDNADQTREILNILKERS